MQWLYIIIYITKCAQKQKRANPLILPILMIVNIGWLYLWKDAVYVLVKLILQI